MKTFSIPENIRTEILNRLSVTESTEGVRILLAVESGSRAWGFESPNSDFDVRFIYARPRDGYLSVDLEDRRDVIEYPIVDDIDLNGWDVRKALKLYSQSNPTFVEWLQSPIVYSECGCFSEQARGLLPTIFSTEKGIYHYRSMAKTNYRGYLLSAEVPLKKYFYVLRPLLAVRWIEKYKSAPPIEFERLLPLLDGDKELLEPIHRLLNQKRASQEMAFAPAIPKLNEFIESELDRLESTVPEKHQRNNSMESLNNLFLRVISEQDETIVAHG